MSRLDSAGGQWRDDHLREGLPLGSVRGIRIRMNWSAVVVFALIAVGLAAWQFPAADPRQARLTYALAGLLTTLVFLASLLAHEVAHSLVARHYGLRVNSITLWLFGGVSDLGGEAVIWWRTHDRVKATVRADQAGQVFGTICVAGGLYAFFLTRDVSWVWIALVGWFLAGAATTEAQQAVLAGRLRGVRAGQVMTPDPVTVPGSMTVREFLTGYFHRAQHQAFPVTVDGQDTVTGLVTVDRIKRVPPHQRDHTRLADIACPLTDVARAAPGDSVADILPRLTECADRRALVFGNGHLAGIITPSDIARLVDRLSPARS